MFTIRFKIASLVVLATGILVVSTLAFLYARHKGEQDYLKTFRLQLGSGIEGVMQLRSSQYEQSAYDYAAWDDMVSYVKSHDPEWAEHNLKYVCKTVGADLLRIYNPGLDLVHEENDSAVILLSHLAMDKRLLAGTFRNKNKTSFFMQTSYGILEVHGSIVVPTEDYERVTEPRGYLLFGKIWDKEYLEELEKATKTDIRIIPHHYPGGSEQDLAQEGKEDYTVTVALKGYDNKMLYTLAFDSRIRPQPENRFFYFFTTLPMILTLLVTVLFMYLIHQWVTRPLRVIQHCLDTDDPSRLSLIPPSNKEFSGVAQALGNTFLVRKKLENEISERKKAEALIQKYASQLEESNASKDKFFSILAHDLKSPFHALLGYSEIMRNDFDLLGTGELRKFIGIIYNSSKQVHDLLENLLQWSRLQTGRVVISQEFFDISREADAVIGLLQGQAIKKKITLRNMIPEGTMVYADATMIRSILLNLFNNAIKFTPAEGEIWTEAFLQESGLMEVRVTDTGIGINPADLSKLFRIDVQFSRKGTENEAGTGLGLVICKETVLKNGGDIFAESVPGHGSTFIFTLPVAPPCRQIGNAMGQCGSETD